MKFLLAASVASATLLNAEEAYCGCGPKTVCNNANLASDVNKCVSCDNNYQNAGSYADAGVCTDICTDRDKICDICNYKNLAKTTDICKDHSYCGPNVNKKCNDVKINKACYVNKNHCLDHVDAVPIAYPYKTDKGSTCTNNRNWNNNRNNLYNANNLNNWGQGYGNNQYGNAWRGPVCNNAWGNYGAGCNSYGGYGGRALGLGYGGYGGGLYGRGLGYGCGCGGVGCGACRPRCGCGRIGCAGGCGWC